MKLALVDRFLLGVAAIFLGLIALRPLFTPEVARAQSSVPHYYVEPGIHMLLAPDRSRQTQGKIVVDMITGDVYGFPTSTDTPYWIGPVKTQPVTSSAMYLGRFDLAGMRRSQ
jgi:hypothetical protein